MNISGQSSISPYWGALITISPPEGENLVIRRKLQTRRCQIREFSKRTSRQASLTATRAATQTHAAQVGGVNICDQYGSVGYNGGMYIVQKNLWNQAPGSKQCLSVDTAQRGIRSHNAE